jgi:hypothetical protein
MKLILMPHQFFTQDLNTRNVCAEMVPTNFIDNQERCQTEMLAHMLEQLKAEPGCFNWAKISDRSWIFQQAPETERQGEEWYMPKSPRQKKACKSK